jgi:cytochrome c2
MSDRLPSPNRGRLVLVLFGIVVGGVAGWLLVQSPQRPVPTQVTPQAEGPEQPIAYYLARADAARGEAIFARCASCHTIGEGSPPGIGPNLWGALGGPVAARPGFAYSPALRALGGRWDWETVSRFLRAPRDAAPGTRMSFGGLADPQERADLMLYLNRQGGSLTPPAGGR